MEKGRKQKAKHASNVKETQSKREKEPTASKVAPLRPPQSICPRLCTTATLPTNTSHAVSIAFHNNPSATPRAHTFAHTPCTSATLCINCPTSIVAANAFVKSPLVLL